jgi:8-oxo-dGTP pyrophosphatase MutT (NUDIX family)
VSQPAYEVVGSVERFRGQVVALRTDQVRMSDGSIAVRDIVEHPGAVAIAALDELNRIVLVRQYRHPVGHFLDELPAGLLDIDGEPAIDAAKRELAEEAGLAASIWHTLVDVHTSPGGSDEAVRVYLARGLTVAAAQDGFVLADEELQLTVTHVPLDDAVQRVLAGDITNSLAVAGILAAARVVGEGEANLRAPGIEWPGRPGR